MAGDLQVPRADWTLQGLSTALEVYAPNPPVSKGQLYIEGCEALFSVILEFT